MRGMDLAMLAGYLVILFYLGWRYRSARTDSGPEFFLAGRSMGVFPVGLSVMVTTFSTVNFLAFSGEVFFYGLYVLVSLPVFFLVAWPVAGIWIPFFRKMEFLSVYEYFEKRFDRRVRMLASGLFIVWRLFWMELALYVSAKIITALTGFPLIPAILLCGVVASLYTSVGGMRAVMWTDVLQFFVLFGGISIVTAFLLIDLGSFSKIAETVLSAGKLKPFDPFDADFFSLDPGIRITFWSGLIGTSCAFLARYGADQMVIQRYFSAKSLSAARMGIWLNAFASVLTLLILAVFGLAVYAYAVKLDLVSPLFQKISFSAEYRKTITMSAIVSLIRSLPPGVAGLFCAGLFAAAMSSIDSGLNSCCAAYVNDFEKTLALPKIPAWITTLIAGATITGGACLVMPVLGHSNSIFAIVNRFVNALGSPLLAMMLLAMFFKKANAPGVFAGGICGIVFSVLMPSLTRNLALHYYAALNLFSTLGMSLVFSAIFVRAGYVPAPESLKYLWRKNVPSEIGEK